MHSQHRNVIILLGVINMVEQIGLDALQQLGHFGNRLLQKRQESIAGENFSTGGTGFNYTIRVTDNSSSNAFE